MMMMRSYYTPLKSIFHMACYVLCKVFYFSCLLNVTFTSARYYSLGLGSGLLTNFSTVGGCTICDSCILTIYLTFFAPESLVVFLL